MIGPLQTELFALGLVYVLTPVFVGYWTYRNARKRASEKAINWALALFLFGLLNPLALAVGIVLYLSVREGFGGPAADSNDSGE